MAPVVCHVPPFSLFFRLCDFDPCFFDFLLCLDRGLEDAELVDDEELEVEEDENDVSLDDDEEELLYDRRRFFFFDFE